MYHSAIKGFKEYKKTHSLGFNSDRLTGIVFNIEKDPIPDAFKKADFIYSELPWQKGYEEFNNRLHTKGKGWGFLLHRSVEIAKELNVPFYFVAGKSASKHMQGLINTQLYWGTHKCQCVMYSSEKVPYFTVESFLYSIYNKHNIGLDLCCGYGLLGKIALKHRKKAILADYNPYCIGYIKDVLLNENI